MENNISKSIGIVGGGIAGLYIAWKMAQKGHKITLFECLETFGGRIETVDLMGFKAECGPMRFELATQPMFTHFTQQELGIEFSAFAQPTSEDPEFTRHLLKEREKSSAQIKAEQDINANNNTNNVNNDSYQSVLSHLTASLDLLKYGIYRIFNPEQRHLSLAEVVESKDGISSNSLISKFADSLNNDDYNDIRTHRKLHDQYLHELGLWNALAHIDILSSHAVAKIRDFGTFYHLIPENPSASEWSIFWLRLFRTDAALSTIPSGVYAIINKIIEKIKELPNNNVDLITNAFVTKVGHSTIDKKVNLSINISNEHGFNTHSIDFDHVILTIPKTPLQKIQDSFPKQIKKHINGVIAFPLLKLFLVTDDPWWSNDNIPQAQYGAHTVPTREVHYFPIQKHEGKDLGMIMLYTDRPANAYWQPYVQEPHFKSQNNTPVELKNEIARHVYTTLKAYFIKNNNDNKDNKQTGKHASILERPENEAIQELQKTVTAFAIRDWSHMPFGGACHAWAPGVIVPTALNELKAFGLVGRAGENNVHICGESYCDYQGFIEGSLRSAKSVMDSI
jgi:Flavin containing amine oxidoreductase